MSLPTPPYDNLYIIQLQMGTRFVRHFHRKPPPTLSTTGCWEMRHKRQPGILRVSTVPSQSAHQPLFEGHVHAIVCDESCAVNRWSFVDTGPHVRVYVSAVNIRTMAWLVLFQRHVRLVLLDAYCQV